MLRRRMSVSVGAFVVMSLAVLSYSIRPRYVEFIPDVTLVLPKGWKGVILAERPSTQRDPAVIPSKVVIQVPPSGIITQRDSDVFFSNLWIKVSIISGSNKLPTLDEDQNLQDDVIAFRDTTVSDERGVWMVVGTRADWESFLAGTREPGPIKVTSPK